MNKLTLKQLDAGVEAAIANADSLIKEAMLLYQSGFHARAYTLSHIAREELAKVTMLYTSGLRMLVGHPVDWPKLYKRLRNHESKLANESLTMFVNTPDADESYLEKMLAGTSVRNEWKNDSLYIGLKEQVFKTPAEMITPKKAERTIGLALAALYDARRFLSQGGKLVERDPEKTKRAFGHINADKLTPDDALKLIKELKKLIHANSGSSKSSES